jgi:hypothetical protein
MLPRARQDRSVPLRPFVVLAPSARRQRKRWSAAPLLAADRARQADPLDHRLEGLLGESGDAKRLDHLMVGHSRGARRFLTRRHGLGARRPYRGAIGLPAPASAVNRGSLRTASRRALGSCGGRRNALVRSVEAAGACSLPRRPRKQSQTRTAGTRRRGPSPSSCFATTASPAMAQRSGRSAWMRSR